MSTVTSLVVDTLVYMHADGTYRFEPVLHRDGSALDLTGKTVTATIRGKRAPHHILHSTYEDMAVTNGNLSGDHDATEGGVSLDVSLNSAYFYTPPRGDQWEDYYVQFHVMPDDYYPARMLIHVTRTLD